MLISLITPYSQQSSSSNGQTAVNVVQLPHPTRACIVQYLLKRRHITAEMGECSLSTCQPRNYLIDLMLASNAEMPFEDGTGREHQSQASGEFTAKGTLRLPLTLMANAYKRQWAIDCLTSKIGIGHFETLQKIGEGTYSEVFLVERRCDRHLMCLKRINKAQCRQNGDLQMIRNEFEVLQIPSKYRTRLYYCFEDEVYVYMVTEWCCLGDLNSLIRNNRKIEECHKLTVTEKCKIFIQLALGIANLHARGYIYRDLKPENILIDHMGQIKICDFGFACPIKPNQTLKERCGSYEYLGPEVIRGEEYNRSLDLYCLGLLFYELLTGSNPFEGTTPHNMAQMKNKVVNFDKKSINPVVKDLLKKMMRDRPEQRLGYADTMQIFHHQFFKENQDLVVKVINGETQLKHIKYSPPYDLEPRKDLQVNEEWVFPKNRIYNYLTPLFDVSENVGPKFNFTR